MNDSEDKNRAGKLNNPLHCASWWVGSGGLWEIAGEEYRWDEKCA